MQRVGWSLAAAVLCLAAVTLGALWSLHGSPVSAIPVIQPPFGGKKQVNLLVLGIDDGQGGQGRSDTMILAHVDTVARRITALSIPRDTRVTLGDGISVKINAAHARGGPKLAAEVVSQLTGLPVDGTLATDFGGFGKLVDLVGGIDLDVEQAMDYDDDWGNLHIHLKPGLQHLDGARAIQYVRYRKSNSHHGCGDGSDISRIARQQHFLEAVAARCLVIGNLTRLPEIAREGRRQIRTNLAINDLLYLGQLAKEIGPQGVKVLSVPGKTALIGGQSYWIPGEAELASVARELNGASSPSGAEITVAVLNASRRRGLGHQVASELEQRGYRIATVATSDEAAPVSRVVAAAPCRARAEAIANLLRCDCAVGRPVPTEAGHAQVTVVVGQDYAAEQGATDRG
jgi:LCP family protein required for cell wall assembly